MEKSTKRYVKGSAKERKFSSGDPVIDLDLLKSDLDKLEVTEAGYIKLRVAPRKEADQYGNTHSVYVNDWKPDGSAKKPTNPPIKAKAKDDLPF